MEKEILQFLNENDGIDYREMIDFFIEKFPNPNTAIYLAIVDSLVTLSDKRLIEFNPFKQNWFGFLGKDVAVNKTGNELTQCTFEIYKSRYNNEWNYCMEAKITFDGKRELFEMVFKDSLAAVNQSVIDTNTFQRKIGWRTLIVAGLSFLAIAVSAYYSSKSVTGEQLLQLKTILQDNNSLLNKMQQSQKAIDSSLRLMARDSLKKILILKKP